MSKLKYNTDRCEEFRNDIKKLPYIQFPSHWYVKPIGPFGGASARFLVTLDPKSNHRVSIYADLYNRLGYYDGPHWEVYPGNIEGDNCRCDINDVDGLLELIAEGLVPRDGPDTKP